MSNSEVCTSLLEVKLLGIALNQWENEVKICCIFSSLCEDPEPCLTQFLRAPLSLPWDWALVVHSSKLLINTCFFTKNLFCLCIVNLQYCVNFCCTVNFTVQQSDSVIHLYTFFFMFFSIMIYHRILNIISCATQ